VRGLGLESETEDNDDEQKRSGAVDERVPKEAKGNDDVKQTYRRSGGLNDGGDASIVRDDDQDGEAKDDTKDNGQNGDAKSDTVKYAPPIPPLNLVFPLAWFDYCGVWFGNKSTPCFPMQDIRDFLRKRLLLPGGTLAVSFYSRPGNSEKGKEHKSHGMAASGFLHRVLIEYGYRPIYVADQFYKCHALSSPFMCTIFITVE
jgi:hypothetical protein